MRKWVYRILDALLGSAPLLIMVVLAGATWWLVLITPGAPANAAAKPVRADPDYIVNDFISERFDQSGAMRSWLSGDEARHYPADKHIAIDRVKMMSTETSAQDEQEQPVLGTPDIEFFRTTAIADQGYILNEREVIELHNNAYVTRQPLLATGSEDKVEFWGDELRILVNEDRMVSDKPVDIAQNGSRFVAQSMVYHNATNTLDMVGAVRGVVIQRAKKK